MRSCVCALTPLSLGNPARGLKSESGCAVHEDGLLEEQMVGRGGECDGVGLGGSGEGRVIIHSRAALPGWWFSEGAAPA